MQTYSVEGISNFDGGEFDKIHIEGISKCRGNIKAQTIEVEGVFHCEGELDTDFFGCEGVTNVKDNIRAKRVEIEGVFTQTKGSKIEAEAIICTGLIKTRGEISADLIEAEGCIEADEIVGDYIKILSHFKAHNFIDIFRKYHSKVRMIEATIIEISGVAAETVNGKDITIGPNCKIDSIDCSGTLYIHPKATVGNVTGKYISKR